MIFFCSFLVAFLLCVEVDVPKFLPELTSGFKKMPTSFLSMLSPCYYQHKLSLSDGELNSDHAAVAIQDSSDGKPTNTATNNSFEQQDRINLDSEPSPSHRLSFIQLINPFPQCRPTGLPRV